MEDSSESSVSSGLSPASADEPAASSGSFSGGQSSPSVHAHCADASHLVSLVPGSRKESYLAASSRPSAGDAGVSLEGAPPVPSDVVASLDTTSSYSAASSYPAGTLNDVSGSFLSAGAANAATQSEGGGAHREEGEPSRQMATEERSDGDRRRLERGGREEAAEACESTEGGSQAAQEDERAEGAPPAAAECAESQAGGLREAGEGEGRDAAQSASGPSDVRAQPDRDASRTESEERREEMASTRPSAYSIVYPGHADRVGRTQSSLRNRASGASSSSGASAAPSSSRDRGGDTRFECNICFDEATDPVVTRCGHLFCWRCLHAWLQRGANECPVCKGHTTTSNVIPIYGRGAEKHPRDAPDKGDAAAGPTPERPRAERPEPQPQRRSDLGFGGGSGGASFSFSLFPFFGLGVTWGSGGLSASNFSASSAFDWLFVPPGTQRRSAGMNRQDQVLSEEQQRMQSLGFLLLAFFFVMYIIFIA
ncbi:zinc finger, C3HC4 type (RING finger) domain-containing protein [Besnoitia besnoiti]|uniref:RING-type E3 ubiquitin transferase n=1 Tax=Besnoitia besnoiti TaxID=94643 RepID=A0A2A9MD97_BESBE|nr:zinc finger, C3HC4 type (RING finger) domain-containing protein [Besnoitia besnoiti]PFH35965.1 zinc finger, C3HC4 type (RING finger) domain-containing protein [Besnoitia besnoiti]